MASPLGTLLATRLDAVLGTTLAQHPVLLDGGKSYLATQAAAGMHGQESVIRRSGEHAGEAAARTGRSDTHANIDRHGRPAAAAQPRPPQGITPSARAVLSEPARTLLALLLLPSESARPRPAALPLWRDPPVPSGDTGTPMKPADQAAAGRGTAPSGTSPPPAAQASGHPSSRSATTATNNAALQSAHLSPAPRDMAVRLASALADSVAFSGLFYESHLAQMSFGQRSPAQLFREPQASTGQRVGGEHADAAEASPSAKTGTPTSPSDNASRTAHFGTPINPSTASGDQTSHHQASARSASGLPGSSGGIMGVPNPPNPTINDPGARNMGVPDLTGTGVHPDTAPLVRQQLETLANSQFTWQGEAWPGAEMEWEVQDESGRQEAERQNAWSSRLRLQLPGLGEVEARLSLVDGQVVMRLTAPESADSLRTHAAVLQESMARAGLTLSDLAIASTDSSKQTSGHPPTEPPP